MLAFFVRGDFCQRTRQPCWVGLAISTGMLPGRPDLGSSCPQGPTNVKQSARDRQNRGLLWLKTENYFSSTKAISIKCCFWARLVAGPWRDRIQTAPPPDSAWLGPLTRWKRGWDLVHGFPTNFSAFLIGWWGNYGKYNCCSLVRVLSSCLSTWLDVIFT